MTPVLCISDLRATAGGGALLDGLDLTLDPGRVLAVVGASGAGKSTLGLAVLGECAPGVTLSGTVLVGGTDLVGPDPTRRRELRAGRVGHLPQHPGAVLDPVRRCDRVLDELAATVHGRDRVARRAAVAAALERVRLDPALARRHPHQLSGGQQQRMALAQTVVTAPDVVVLDEPTTGLDPATAAELVGQLGDLAASGTALVLLTHDHDVARALADEVIELVEGRVARRGTPQDLLGARDPVVTRPGQADGAARLVVEGVTVGAPDGTPILDDVTVQAGTGEWVAVHGRSGAGKTTLARVVAGLVAPRVGSVTVDGTRLAPAVTARDRGHRALVQYVHQDAASSFLPDRPVLDQVARGAVLLRGRAVSAALTEARDLLARLGVEPGTVARRPGSLSGGQLQRAAVARALLVRPAVLVADEMTSALDPEHRRDLLLLVDDLRRDTGTTVLAVSHDLDASALVADRVVVLDGGRVAEVRETAELLADPHSAEGRALVGPAGGS
ncbi:ATP-binding cassette domain-containing protein [Actinomycetospora sp. OC33-EN08]|uniref:ATP-binding cassette domain-containing protein n=1 Tax=Actinomycetospora aurantiaca TaxID=3129233 RepID=A0ABU8MMZ6_9PSEU